MHPNEDGSPVDSDPAKPGEKMRVQTPCGSNFIGRCRRLWPIPPDAVCRRRPRGGPRAPVPPASNGTRGETIWRGGKLPRAPLARVGAARDFVKKKERFFARPG